MKFVAPFLNKESTEVADLKVISETNRKVFSIYSTPDKKRDVLEVAYL